MTVLAHLVIAAVLIVSVGSRPTWGQSSWNPTESDLHGNTAGGDETLRGRGHLSAGNGNTGFGIRVLRRNAGDANTGVGAEALRNNTTGSDNTAIGNDALRLNKTGLANTASGAEALSRNTTGNLNTASGASALSSNTTGSLNTADGVEALVSNTTGEANTASGAAALRFNTTGAFNTASGFSALNLNTTGESNTASGVAALSSNTIGANNTAVGYQALLSSSGNNNIGVGHEAGFLLTSGNHNIYLGHTGVASESKTMRLGGTQTKKTFIEGIATASVTGTQVLIDATGRLGVPLSSARYKRDIETMGARSEGVLKLRPVTFVYTQDGQGMRQYGLIAEEVATLYPELVTRTATGEVQAVRYQELIPMLVNELQRQQHVTDHLQRELTELRSLVGQMRGGVAQR